MKKSICVLSIIIIALIVTTDTALEAASVCEKGKKCVYDTPCPEGPTNSPCPGRSQAACSGQQILSGCVEAKYGACKEGEPEDLCEGNSDGFICGQYECGGICLWDSDKGECGYDPDSSCDVEGCGGTECNN